MIFFNKMLTASALASILLASAPSAYGMLDPDSPQSKKVFKMKQVNFLSNDPTSTLQEGADGSLKVTSMGGKYPLKSESFPVKEGIVEAPYNISVNAGGHVRFCLSAGRQVFGDWITLEALQNGKNFMGSLKRDIPAGIAEVTLLFHSLGRAQTTFMVHDIDFHQKAEPILLSSICSVHAMDDGNERSVVFRAKLCAEAKKLTEEKRKSDQQLLSLAATASSANRDGLYSQTIREKYNFDEKFNKQHVLTLESIAAKEKEFIRLSIGDGPAEPKVRVSLGTFTAATPETLTELEKRLGWSAGDFTTASPEDLKELETEMIEEQKKNMSDYNTLRDYFKSIDPIVEQVIKDMSSECARDSKAWVTQVNSFYRK